MFCGTSPLEFYKFSCTTNTKKGKKHHFRLENEILVTINQTLAFKMRCSSATRFAKFAYDFIVKILLVLKILFGSSDRLVYLA